MVLNAKGVVVENLSKKYEGRKNSSYFLSEDGIVVNFEDHKNAVLLNGDGKEELRTDYSYLGAFRDGAAVCKKAGKYGLIDKKGNEILFTEYEELSDPYRQNILLKKAGKWYLCKFSVESAK